MKNIVFVTYDSLRADHCGHHGYGRETTPNMDAMADEGIAFKNAISPASRTNPSMAGIFTGEHMAFSEQVSNPDISRDHLSQHGTLAQDLSSMGYTTGAFNPNAYASRYYGFDQGFDYYEDFLFSSDQYQTLFDKHLSESDIFHTIRNLRNFVRREEVFRTWESYIDDVEQWARNQEQPFFLWMFSLDTHFPYLTPRQYRQFSSLFDQYYYNWKCNQLINKLDPELADRTVKKIINIYDDSILFADALLGELQERLDDFDPVFVIHGDHGEAFGEDRMYGHFYPSLNEENVHVPTVVWGEQIESSVINDPFDLTNIPDLLQQIASEDHQTEEFGGEIVTNSDFDGRRNRQIVSARSATSKCIVEVGPNKTEQVDYSVIDKENIPIGEALVDEFQSLEEACQRRLRHLNEINRIQNKATGIWNKTKPE